MLHFFGPLATKFSTYIRNLFDYDLVVPYEYTFYNRNIKKSRAFSNYKEILSALEKNYPEKNVTFFKGNFKFLKETVHRHAIIKWYFSFSGSNCMNLFFMKERMSALIAMPIDFYDLPAICSIFARSLKVMTFQTEAIWQIGKAIVGNISRILYYANISFSNEMPIYYEYKPSEIQHIQYSKKEYCL